MLLLLNILGLIVFIGVGYAFSLNRKAIDWRSVGTVFVLELFLAWFFTSFSIGREIVDGAAAGFNWLVQVSYKGIAFALPDWVTPPANGQMNFVTSALLPILMIVPMFDILAYIGFLPWVIKWVGKGLSFITGQPKFESFFAIEMMFLGNTEVLAISKTQLSKMNQERNLTIALMSMSCVTASIIGAYTQMMPGQYVLAAIPLNILSAIIVSALINPVQVSAKDDVIYNAEGHAEGDKKAKKTAKEPFFSFLGDSILGAGRLILIITASVIAFVALAELIDALFGLTGLKWLSLENILGVIMFPFAWLLGLDPHQAFEMARLMGTKLVTNEFVVMGGVGKAARTGAGLFKSAHFTAALTVFVTSFANFSTVGMIIGAFKGLVSKDKVDYISSNVPRMLITGILVSLLSAGTAALFVW